MVRKDTRVHPVPLQEHLGNPGAPHKLAATTSQEVSPHQEAIRLTLILAELKKRHACISVPLARSELTKSELTETVFVNLLTLILPGKVGRNLGMKAGKLGWGGALCITLSLNYDGSIQILTYIVKVLERNKKLPTPLPHPTKNRD